MKALRISWVLVILVGLVACSGGAGATGQSAEPTALPPVAAPAQVVSDGRVIPAHSANLSFGVSGVVAEVLAGEGEPVAAGAVIARLGGAEQREAAVAAAEMEALSAQQALDQIARDAELASAQAQLKVAEAEKAMDKATKRRISKDYHVGDQEQVDLSWSEYIRTQKAVEDAERVWEYFKNRDPQDVDRAEVLAQMARARQTRDTALANYNYLRSKPDQFEVNQAEAELQVARATLAAARLTLEGVKDGPDPDQRALAEARLHNAEASLAAAKAALADLSLVAPISGMITANPLKVGELVGPGAAPVVVADLTNWHVETTDLTEVNVIDVHVGDKVRVAVDALPEVELGGRVTTIELQGQNHQGDIVYAVRVDLDKQDPRLRWNMTASVTFGE